MITFENVCFNYGTEGANVENLSFHIGEGEFVAVVGENGAGKTTTVKLMNGLLMPKTGKVVISGLDTAKSKVSERAKNIGYLFQNPDRQICQNTVYDEIAFGLKTVKFGSKEKIAERVKEVLELFGFNGDEEPFMLSRGQRQRVALASVIAAEPKVLILDEPTTGLDYKECCHIMELIKKMNAEFNTTVVMVCHDMEVVSDYAKRILVMAKGGLIADGSTDEVFRNTEVMKKASLLPPQIVELSTKLQLNGVNTIDQMTNYVKAALKEI